MHSNNGVGRRITFLLMGWGQNAAVMGYRCGQGPNEERANWDR